MFEQFVDAANLAVLRSEQQRTVILLLAYTGLRASSIVTLSRDALEIGSDGHPYLRYLNVEAAPGGDDPDRPRARRADPSSAALPGGHLRSCGTRFLLPSPPEGQLGWSRTAAVAVTSSREW